MRYISANEIVGVPDSDLVFDNEITGVEYEENRVKLNFAFDERNCISTDKIYSSDRGGYYSLYTYVDKYNKTWLIGQFKAKYELDGLIEIGIASEVWCTMDYDGEDTEGGEAYVWDSVSDFMTSIQDNRYDNHTGGIISTDSGIDFEIEQDYIFAVNISNVSEFVINWGAPVEVRFYTTASRTELVGTRERPFTLETNEFFQTETKIGSVTIGQYIAQNIRKFWKNGKQNMNITVNVTDDNTIYKVEDIVTILDCRADEINFNDQTQINRHSIARYPDGSAKTFKITSAEFQYNGTFRQALQMIENVEIL